MEGLNGLLKNEIREREGRCKMQDARKTSKAKNRGARRPATPGGSVGAKGRAFEVRVD